MHCRVSDMAALLSCILRMWLQFALAHNISGQLAGELTRKLNKQPYSGSDEST